MSNAGSRIFHTALMLTLMIGLAAGAGAGTVSGIYANHAGKPLPEHQVHFQNRISGDMYLARSGADGSFSADLPPGVYDLRAERGLVIKPHIVVGDTEVNVGRVSEDKMILEFVRHPFERQGIAPALVDSAAPATAHVANGAPEGSGAATFWAPTTQAPVTAPSSTTH